MILRSLARSWMSLVVAGLLLLASLADPRNCDATSDPNRVGINVNEPGFVEEEAWDSSKEAGFGWVRIKAWWAEMQSEGPDSYDFGAFRTRIERAKSHGFKVLVTFQTIPWWANDTEKQCQVFNPSIENECKNGTKKCCAKQPHNPEMFAKFVEEVISEFQGMIDAYEIWNEPNLTHFWYESGGDAANFMDLIVTPGTEVIKRMDPGKEVLGPATYHCKIGYPVPPYQNQYLERACSSITAVSVHENKHTLTFMERDLATCENLCDKPIWVTEYSYFSSTEFGWLGEKGQADAYRDAILATGEGPIDNLFIFRWGDTQYPTNEQKSLPRRWNGIIERREGDRKFRPKKAFWDIRDLLVAGDDVIRDTFALDAEEDPPYECSGQPRCPGYQLHTTLSEVGEIGWEADGTAVFENNELVHVGQGHHVGGIPLNPYHHSNHSVAVIEADLHVTGSNWVGLGFSRQPTTNFWNQQAGQVWGLLKPDGEFRVKAMGSVYNLATVTESQYSFHGNELNHVRIEFNLNENTVSAWVGGGEGPAQAFFDLDDLNPVFYPEFLFAGFHMNNNGKPSATMSIDNFSVAMRGGPQLAPSILAHPSSSVSVATGDTVFLEVVANGVVPRSYLWDHDGIPLIDDGRIMGSESPRLTISQTTQSDAGSYKCRVSNYLGWAESHTSVVTILGGVEITLHPTDRTNFEGRDVTFSVAATGPPPLEYQWLKDGVELQDIGGGKISGSRSPEVTIRYLDTSDEGSYRCRVSHGTDSVMSNSATLDVASPIIRDSFSGVIAGVPIKDRLTELGSVQWYSNPSTVGALDQAVTAGPTGNIHATVPYYLRSGHVANVTANLLMDGSEWAAVGFTENHNLAVWSDGRVWVWIKSNGTFRVCAKGVAACPMASALPITGFVSGGYNEVSLDYDRTNDTVEVWINGIHQYGPAIAALGTTPSINHVGLFSLNPTSNQTMIDDFSVSHHCPGCSK